MAIVSQPFDIRAIVASEHYELCIEDNHDAVVEYVHLSVVGVGWPIHYPLAGALRLTKGT